MLYDFNAIFSSYDFFSEYIARTKEFYIPIFKCSMNLTIKLFFFQLLSYASYVHLKVLHVSCRNCIYNIKMHLCPHYKLRDMFHWSQGYWWLLEACIEVNFTRLTFQTQTFEKKCNVKENVKFVLLNWIKSVPMILFFNIYNTDFLRTPESG